MMMRLTIVIVFSAISFAVNVQPTSAENKVKKTHIQRKTEWWQNAVFYQIYPRSFKDSKGTGTGDLRGIIENLEYFKEVGVDAVWLSPIFTSPMEDFGYDVSDYFDIDPLFGTLKDMDELFEKAKKIDLKIILDFVLNHSSDQCEWFKKSIKREDGFEDFYVWHDGKKDQWGNLIYGPDGKPLRPNNWMSIFQGPAWTFNKERHQYYLHQFDKKQPDLNYSNEKVVAQMEDVLLFWLNKGAAGFRVDALNFLYEDKQFRDEPLSNKTNDSNSVDYVQHIYTRDLPEDAEFNYKLRDITDKYYHEHGGIKPILMVEAYTTPTEYLRYFASDDGKKEGSHIPFNFVLLDFINGTSTASDYKQVIDGHISYVNNLTRLNWVIGNHDRPRVSSRLRTEQIDAQLTLAMTLPGIGVTYQGEEIGMLDNRDGISFEETLDLGALHVGKNGSWKYISRDPARTPFQWTSGPFAGFMPANATGKPWLPIHPNYADLNVEVQLNDKRSTLKYYKQLTQIRKNSAFTNGGYKSKVLGNSVFSYVRSDSRTNDTYVVLINFGPREQRVNVTELTTKLAKTSKIAIAGTNSHYSEGQLLDTENIFLRRYDTVIIKSSATINIASVFGLLIISIVCFIF